jgi:hypothetical protein
MKYRFAILVVTGSVALAGLGASLAAVESQTAPPRGDQGVTYQCAVIDVPTTWKVTFANTCPSGGPGLVYVGRQVANLGCPPTSSGSPVNWVWFSPSTPAVKISSPMYGPMTVHGLRVYSYKTPQPMATRWVVPSLDVQINVVGPTGPRVLRSLHAGS